ncbi:MFS transporter [Candidatus Uhrbacteria bacterium]|nr:MFS transporter [Candidatus Uhrbacteria bacterium]
MRNLRIFSAIGFLKGLYFYIPIFTFFLLAQHISLSAIVISQVFYSLFIFIGEVPTGIFADRFGQKASMLIGYFLEASGIALVLIFPTTVGLFVAYAVRGLAGSFLSGSEEALLFESVKHSGKQNFQKVYGRFLGNEQIGFIISPAIAGVVYQRFGEQAFVPLIIFTIFCIAVTGAASLFLKDFKATIADPAEGAGMFSLLKRSFFLIRHNKTIFILTVVGALTLTGEYFVQAVYQPYFAINHVPAFWVGAALSIGALLNTIATRNVYILERHFSLEKILLSLNLILSAAYILMAMLVHPIFLVGLFILLNGLYNLQAPIVSDYINTRTKSSIRTTVLSGISFIRRFFQIFATWILGVTVGVFGTQISLVLQGVYLLIGILIGYYLLVRCGCTYKVANIEGEELKFNE